MGFWKCCSSYGRIFKVLSFSSSKERFLNEKSLLKLFVLIYLITKEMKQSTLFHAKTEQKTRQWNRYHYLCLSLTNIETNKHKILLISRCRLKKSHVYTKGERERESKWCVSCWICTSFLVIAYSNETKTCV